MTTAYVRSYLLDSADRDAPALAKGWVRLADETLESLFAEVRMNYEMGGAFFDGDAYESLAEEIADELNRRFDERQDPAYIAAEQARQDECSPLESRVYPLDV